MEPISRIDPTSNQLFFRGFNVTELCTSASFESVLYLLLYSRLPTAEEHQLFFKRMINLRRFHTENDSTLNDLAMSLNHLIEISQLDLQEALLTFIAVSPIVVAKQICEFESRKVMKPNEDLRHVANFIWMTKGIHPYEVDVRDLETSLILHMDDPSNPSLTSLMTCIKDGMSVSEALLAALNVHSGALHHGAGTEAMRMFEEIRNVNDIEEYLKKRLDSGKKIFGLGHRIYQATDPRASVLRKILERRIANTPDAWLLEIIDAVTTEGHAALKNLKNIEAYPNVDLYNASVYYSLGFPPSFNTELFAIARGAGWMAHVLEWHSG